MLKDERKTVRGECQFDVKVYFCLPYQESRVCSLRLIKAAIEEQGEICLSYNYHEQVLVSCIKYKPQRAAVSSYLGDSA